MEMLPGKKGCRIRSGPFLEMLPMKRRKTMNGYTP